MNLIRKFIGPKSKYKDDIPYTYEARVSIFEAGSEYNSYIADTICALVEHLESKGLFDQRKWKYMKFSRPRKNH